jgi:hypothetical protein
MGTILSNNGHCLDYFELIMERCGVQISSFFLQGHRGSTSYSTFVDNDAGPFTTSLKLSPWVWTGVK